MWPIIKLTTASHLQKVLHPALRCYLRIPRGGLDVKKLISLDLVWANLPSQAAEHRQKKLNGRCDTCASLSGESLAQPIEFPLSDRLPKVYVGLREAA